MKWAFSQSAENADAATDRASYPLPVTLEKRIHSSLQMAPGSGNELNDERRVAQTQMTAAVCKRGFRSFLLPPASATTIMTSTSPSQTIFRIVFRHEGGQP